MLSGMWRLRWARAIGIAMLLLLVGFFGQRAYQDWQSLHQPPAARQDATQIRPWMTVRFIANSHHVPVAGLAEQLGAPRDGNVTLVQLAHARGAPVPAEESDVRRAVVALGADPGPPPGPGPQRP